ERSGPWGAALDEIERQIGEPATITWFEPLRFDEEARALIAPDSVFEEWINNNYREIFEAAINAAGLDSLPIIAVNESRSQKGDQRGDNNEKRDKSTFDDARPAPPIPG